jgi:DNA repair protein RecN (Recombination protein N)
MLTYLNVKNFAIIDSLELEFKPGMTVITGETGAGKSIVIDTLELVLGARADASSIRQGAERCEISAIFDLANLPAAQEWLQAAEFCEDPKAVAHECILRRTINIDGRTRSTINGLPCTQQNVRELGSFLLDIHGQHEYQTLLKREQQRALLDSFAGHLAQVLRVRELFQDWQKAARDLESWKNVNSDRAAKIELLQHHLKELENLNVVAGEVENLHAELKRLSNAELILNNCQAALAILHDERSDDSASLLVNLNRAKECLLKAKNSDESLQEFIGYFDNAAIQLETAAAELAHYLDKQDLNPERLRFVEERLSLIHALARKHHLKDEGLHEIAPKFKAELEQLENANATLAAKEKAQALSAAAYLKVAQQLSQSRQQAAQKLEKEVTAKMQLLGMQGGCFAVQLQKVAAKIDAEFGATATDTREGFSAGGLEQVEFLVSTNPGQPLLPLAKVASGGELSRLSLAIQVLTAEKSATPTLIFDEVDVGIGGKTAEIVGQLLKDLGARAQVLCITHLPQVAAQGHQHLQVIKEVAGKGGSNAKVEQGINVRLEYLEKETRVAEIARMLGGVNVTANTLAHAREMLQNPAKGPKKPSLKA